MVSSRSGKRKSPRPVASKKKTTAVAASPSRHRGSRRRLIKRSKAVSSPRRRPRRPRGSPRSSPKLDSISNRVSTLYSLKTSTPPPPPPPSMVVITARSPRRSCDVALSGAKCYIDAVDAVRAKYPSMTPDQLVDEIYSIIKPRMVKDGVSIANVDTSNMYCSVAKYAARVWKLRDIAAIKSKVMQAKANLHYKPVKLFVKNVKFHHEFGDMY